jgi:ribosomal-protein-alanine N-acetyltransferase
MAVQLRLINPDDPLFAEAAQLRYDVLHRPLGLPRGDHDDADPASRHLVALSGPVVIGYGRLVLSEKAARIRHLAIAPSERRSGLGKAMVTQLIAEARR